MSRYTNLVTNLSKDPNCYKRRNYSWGAGVEGPDEDGRYTYIDRNNSYVSWSDRPLAEQVGKVIFAYVWAENEIPGNLFRPSSGSPLMNVVLDGSAGHYGFGALRVYDDATVIPQFCINGLGRFKVVAFAMYDPEDWEEVYGLYQSGILAQPWFSGDSFPKNN